MSAAIPPDAESFDMYRPLLFGIAYRMVGSVMDAEDIVQETYLQWQRRDEAVVESPKAFLSAIVTRRSIDHLRAARVQRETYVGPWLPEPVIAAREPDMTETAALHESLSMAFLVLLESLTPMERAVFLLHDIFAYDFHEIAGIVGKTEANCRQLAHRARQEVQTRRPRFDSSPEQQERLTQQFLRACTEGDLTGLLSILAEDAVFWSDGGGKARAAYRPITGARHVAAFMLGSLRNLPGPFRTRPTAVNGQPGLIILGDAGIIGVLTLDIADERIQAVRIITNPDKLRTVRVASGGSNAP